MTLLQPLIRNLPIKLLSLALAAALWILATGAKEKAVDLSVPVLFRNPPPGLALAGEAVTRISVTIEGPRLRLLGLRPGDISLELDLGKLGAGTASFGGIEKRLRIPPGVTVMRVYPSVVEVELVPVSGRGPGSKRR